ncbi:hypothetical protein M0R04_10755 [Candidatus Dojkabacteria bacterium]|jgi:hypothetical protein|nr:hypothetical protein [Candidatus Dojkabacteria bacterium]
MNKFKTYKVFEKSEKVIIDETIKRISATGRHQTKQGVLNDMLLEYPVMLKRLKDLQK